MRKLNLALAVACILLAIVVFFLADGARRIYSGMFFVMLAVMFLTTGRRGNT